MSELVERLITTIGREENIMETVVFPYNEDDMKERFQVEDLHELHFADNPGSKMSVVAFNAIISQSDDRIQKIKDQIEAMVKFLKKQMSKHPGWKGISETLVLSIEDSIIWRYFMKDQYKHKDEKVKVWKYSNDLTVYYGEQKG